VTKEKRTVIFVSHNLNSLKQLCTKGILLEKGEILIADDINCTLKHYVNTTSGSRGKIITHAITRTNRFNIQKVTINQSESDELLLVYPDKNLNVELELNLHQNIIISLESRLYDSFGNALGIFSPGHFDNNQIFQINKGRVKIISEILLPTLIKGEYYLDIHLTFPGIEGYCDIPRGVKIISDGKPLSTFGLTFENRVGNGAIILDGKNQVVNN